MFTQNLSFTKGMKLCGRPVYSGISLQQGVTIKYLLGTTSEHPSRCYCCTALPARLKLTTALKHVSQYCRSWSPLQIAKPSTRVAVQIGSHQQSARASMSAATSLPSPPQPHLSGSPPGITPHAGVSNAAYFANQTNSPTLDTLRIVFGIKDLHGYHIIEEMDTHTQLTDATFFQDLKRNHRRYRSFLQRWFSPYVFRYCRFVQVSIHPTSAYPVLTTAVRGACQRSHHLCW